MCFESVWKESKDAADRRSNGRRSKVLEYSGLMADHSKVLEQSGRNYGTFVGRGIAVCSQNSAGVVKSCLSGLLLQVFAKHVYG